MQIKAFAAASGMKPKTIRYYEAIGLIPNAQRSKNGYRVYDQQDVEDMRFIRRCRDLAIPIVEIKKLVEAKRAGGVNCAIADQILDTQLEKIKRQIRELRQLQTSLEELASLCEHEAHKQCESMRKLSQH